MVSLLDFEFAGLAIYRYGPLKCLIPSDGLRMTPPFPLPSATPPPTPQTSETINIGVRVLKPGYAHLISCFFPVLISTVFLTQDEPPRNQHQLCVRAWLYGDGVYLVDTRNVHLPGKQGFTLSKN